MSVRRRAPGAFVTGGARGIGRGIVEALASRGDAVTVADIDVEEAARCAEESTAEGFDVRAVGLDVTDVAEVRRTIADADARMPLVTVVCNAGIASRRPLIDVEPDEYDRLMAVNVRGVYFVLQAALRVMMPRHAGNVVTVSSTSAFTSSTGPMVHYDLSKAAVRMLTIAAAREVAPSGVRINAVAPGTVRTDLVRALATDNQLRDLELHHIPMGRFGTPQEIGAAVAFLSSNEASYVTGHVLVVDGGWLT